MRSIIRAAVLLLGAVALVLVGPAALAEASTGHSSGGSSGGSRGVTAQDRAFLIAIHQANLAEITTGKQAQQKGNSARVRALGRQWVADHTKLDATVKQVAKRYGVSLPTRPNAEQRAQAAKDAKYSGASYDRVWLAGELTGHVKARTAGRTELSKGSNAQVKKIAQTGGPVIQNHINGIVGAQRARA